MTEASDILRKMYEKHPEMTPQKHITPFEVRSAKGNVAGASERGGRNGALAASLRNRPAPTIKRYSWEDNE